MRAILLVLLRIQHKVFVTDSGVPMELTTSQAVHAYGVYPNVLHRMILLGRLRARKDSNGHWLISRESLERWDRTRARKPPKSKQTEQAAQSGV